MVLYCKLHVHDCFLLTYRYRYKQQVLIETRLTRQPKEMKHVVAETTGDVSKVKEALQSGKHIFALIYMEGCGPCNATRPVWKQLVSALNQNAQYKNSDDVVVLEVNKDLLGELPELGGADAFPTLRYYSANGNDKEEFEESDVKKKTRSLGAFQEWVDIKTGMGAGTGSGSMSGGKRRQGRSVRIHSLLRAKGDTPENLYHRLKRAPTPGVVLSKPLGRTRRRRNRSHRGRKRGRRSITHRRHRRRSRSRSRSRQ